MAMKTSFLPNSSVMKKVTSPSIDEYNYFWGNWQGDRVVKTLDEVIPIICGVFYSNVTIELFDEDYVINPGYISGFVEDFSLVNPSWTFNNNKYTRKPELPKRCKEPIWQHTKITFILLFFVNYKKIED